MEHDIVVNLLWSLGERPYTKDMDPGVPSVPITTLAGVASLTECKYNAFY